MEIKHAEVAQRAVAVVDDGAVGTVTVTAASLPEEDSALLQGGELGEPPLAAVTLIPQTEAARIVGDDYAALAQEEAGYVV